MRRGPPARRQDTEQRRQTQRPDWREQAQTLNRLAIGHGEGPEREPEREAKGDRRGQLSPPSPHQSHRDAMLPYAVMPLSRVWRRAGLGLLAMALAIALTYP